MERRLTLESPKLFIFYLMSAFLVEVAVMTTCADYFLTVQRVAACEHIKESPVHGAVGTRCRLRFGRFTDVAIAEDGTVAVNLDLHNEPPITDSMAARIISYLPS